MNDCFVCESEGVGMRAAQTQVADYELERHGGPFVYAYGVSTMQVVS